MLVVARLHFSTQPHHIYMCADPAGTRKGTNYVNVGWLPANVAVGGRFGTLYSEYANDGCENFLLGIRRCRNVRGKSSRLIHTRGWALLGYNLANGHHRSHIFYLQTLAELWFWYFIFWIDQQRHWGATGWLQTSCCSPTHGSHHYHQHVKVFIISSS